jgi:hypothetical protein
MLNVMVWGVRKNYFWVVKRRYSRCYYQEESKKLPKVRARKRRLCSRKRLQLGSRTGEGRIGRLSAYVVESGMDEVDGCCL